MLYQNIKRKLKRFISKIYNKIRSIFKPQKDEIDIELLKAKQLVKDLALDLNFEKYLDELIENYTNIYVAAIKLKLSNDVSDNMKSALLSEILNDILNDELLSATTKQILIEKFGFKDVAIDYIKLKIQAKLLTKDNQ